jgi:hypothetical protein
MTPLEKAVTEWYACRRDWPELGNGRSTYTKADGDAICKRMGAAEVELEAEAAKLVGAQ